MSTSPVGRFAPSPSGRMHLGNLFTALLAWLSVRSENGVFLLRIEDLDPERSRVEYADAIRDDLRWLGIDWDREQPPQSARTEVYRSRFSYLASAAQVYPCYCTRAELSAAAPHGGERVYPGTCRKRLAPPAGRRPSYRLTVPDRDISFSDGVWGVRTENLLRDCGDFVLCRSDGVFAYQLAVVTDDMEGGVTQVVRGRDLLPSTARQMYLYELFGAEPPTYFHVPLLTDGEGRRLSKRDKDLDMGVLRERMTPQALLGVLAFAAGLTERNEPLTAAELIPLFSWQKIKKQDIPIREAF